VLVVAGLLGGFFGVCVCVGRVFVCMLCAFLVCVGVCVCCEEIGAVVQCVETSCGGILL